MADAICIISSSSIEKKEKYFITAYEITSNILLEKYFIQKIVLD